MIKFHYDKKVDALSLRLSDRPYAESEEVGGGIIFDYDQRGKVIGIEILDASHILSPAFRKIGVQKSIPITVEK